MSEEPNHEAGLDVPPGTFASDAVTEDRALMLLESRNMSAEDIEQLAADTRLLKSRKVLTAIACHVHAPRRVTIPIVRQLFAFELMRLALMPAIAADIKLLAEELLVAKLGSTTVGERLSLAKQSSTRIAAALLTDSDPRVRHAALNNPRMTSLYVARALTRSGAPRALAEEVKRHSKWSCQLDIRKVLEGLEAKRSG